MTHAPLDDAALCAHVIGSWLLDPREPSERLPPGLFAATFTRAGDLVYSQRWEEGIERIVLTYRIEGGALVTEQPSVPGEQRSPLSLDDEGRLHSLDLGEPSIFAREAPDQQLDPDAALLALVSVAVRTGLASAAPTVAARSFLLHEDSAGERHLAHFDAATPEAARQAAEQAARTLVDAHACAYALDGYLGGGTHGMHAIVVEASRRGRACGLLLAQPYTFDAHGRAVPSGGLTPPEETARGWLR